jgi:hypothetical protein
MADNNSTPLPFRKKGYRSLNGATLGGPEYVFVYVMKCGPYVKVGVAADPHARLKNILSNSPLPITLIHAVRVPTASAGDIEYEAHCSLHRHHHRNEWFKISASRAVDAVGTGVNVAAGIVKPFAKRAPKIPQTPSLHQPLGAP